MTRRRRTWKEADAVYRLGGGAIYPDIYDIERKGLRGVCGFPFICWKVLGTVLIATREFALKRPRHLLCVRVGDF